MTEAATAATEILAQMHDTSRMRMASEKPQPTSYQIIEYYIKRLLDDRDVEIERLKQQLAESKAVNHGFDRKGKFCNCSWGSGLHGDICPEHGTEGKKIGPDAEIERLKQQLAKTGIWLSTPI